MLKLEPRLIANTNMTEEILKYVGSGTGWARVIMLKSLEERFQKCIFWVRFNIRNSQKFQFKPGCFHQHFTVMEKHGLYDIHHTVCEKNIHNMVCTPPATRHQTQVIAILVISPVIINWRDDEERKKISPVKEGKYVLILFKLGRAQAFCHLQYL